MNTLAELIALLKSIVPVPVFTGVNDQAKPPFLAITDYKRIPTYDTAGIAYWDVGWSIHAIGESYPQAYALLEQANTAIATINPFAINGDAGFVEAETQVTPELYLFDVSTDYSLFVSA